MTLIDKSTEASSIIRISIEEKVCVEALMNERFRYLALLDVGIRTVTTGRRQRNITEGKELWEKISLEKSKILSQITKTGRKWNLGIIVREEGD
jgi:hypothetical protein